MKKFQVYRFYVYRIGWVIEAESGEAALATLDNSDAGFKGGEIDGTTMEEVWIGPVAGYNSADLQDGWTEIVEATE